jgi:MFS transporter, DHA1 family, inner membrane transport protein
MSQTSKTTRSSRRVLTLLGAGMAISLLGDATLYTVLPSAEIAAKAGVTLAMVGVLLGVNRAVRLVFNGPIGALYDRLPRRGLLIASLVLGTFSTMIYALGVGFWPLFTGRVLWGLAWSLLWIGGNTVVLDISTGADRGRLSGLFQMWFFLGVALASFAGGLFTDVLGFRGGLWLSTTLIGGAVLLWVFFLPETRRSIDNPGKDQSNKPPAGAFPWRIVLAASLPMFAYRFVAAGVVAATIIIWLSELFGEQVILLGLIVPIATLSGLFRGLITITSITGAPIAGFLTDKMGKRWPLVGFTSLLGAVGLWLMGVDILAFALLGAFLSQITAGSIGALVPAIAGDSIPFGQQGRALGAIYTIGDLGSTIAPPAALGLLSLGSVTIGEVYQGCALLFTLVGVFSLAQVRLEAVSSRPVG